MKDRKLSGLIVIGDSSFGNPELAYVAGTNLARGGIYIKQRAHQPILVVSNIDVGSARRGRVGQIETYSEYGHEEKLRRYGRSRARIMLYHEILLKHRVKGRIGLYGKTSASEAIATSESLRRSGHKIVGENPPTLLDVLRETKDRIEIDRIREVGKRTESVVRQTMEFLRTCDLKEDRLVADGESLTVGIVKTMIGRFTAEASLINTQDVIFAVGPQSADPHYVGADEDLVRPRLPIVFDIFPQQPGGYWFDTTRTFVVGKASPEIRSMHQSVLEAQLAALDELRDGADGQGVTGHVCDIFEKGGYKTQRDLARGDKEARMIGFIHSLGHGVGLTIGERPNLSVLTEERLKEGHVTTLEPGLYRPGVGGVRIEDTVVITKTGVDNLSSLDKELEL